MKRFYNKTKLDINTRCLNWTGSNLNNGYGRVKINGKTYLAHRIGWELINGKIPKGLFVCHKCDNRKCVNPEHLFLGTQKDNMIDAYNKGKLVIPHGNRFLPGNIPKNSKINKLDVIKIKELLKLNDLKLRDIAERASVSIQQIKDISSGRTYKNIS